MSILIKNATIVTMNANRDIIYGDLLIENDRISRIGKLNQYTADTVIDASNQLLLPGFVQSHVTFARRFSAVWQMTWNYWTGKQRLWP